MLSLQRIVRARPTGPRSARPEDRLLCWASTQAGDGLPELGDSRAKPGHKQMNESSVRD
jgi:hypothetical protein